MLEERDRGIATGGRGLQAGHGPSRQFSNQEKSTNFSFEHQGYCFLPMFKNYTDQKIHNIYRASYNFWTIYGGFSFFNHIGEISHFMFDLLETFDYWQNLGPFEKVL